MITSSYSKNVIRINGNEIILEYSIKDSFVLKDIVIVLFDPDCNLGTQSQFRNMIGLDENGCQVWVAELPTDKISDVYYQVVSQTPLKVSSFCSYECQIDPRTGKILSKAFYK